MNNNKNNLQQMILSTAEELFLDNGYTVTSTTEIAKKVGCNQALIHYYFRTKEALFQAIFNSKIETTLKSFFAITVEDICFEDKLRHIITTHFDIISKNPKLPRLIINEIISNPTRMKDLLDRGGKGGSEAMLKMQKELDEEITEGRIRQIDIVNLMMNIISMNVMTFISYPIITAILNMDEEQKREYIDNRKQEILTTIINSLRP